MRDNFRDEIGVIQDVHFGMDGCDDVQFGLSVTLGGPGWGVNDFEGCWVGEPPSYAQWTRADQTERFGVLCRHVYTLLQDAKARTVADLKGKPVRVWFNGSVLVSWEILKEAIL